MHRLLLILFAVACAPPRAPSSSAVTESSPFAADTLDPQPPWSYEDLRIGALQAVWPLMGNGRREDTAQAVAITEMRVLAWHVTDDRTRPMRVERALIWLRLSGATDRWALANLFRHPVVESVWRAASATHTPYFGARLHAAPPTNADIYAFLDVLDNWRFEEDPNAPFLEADVRERTWLAMTGSNPTRSYPRERTTGSSR